MRPDCDDPYCTRMNGVCVGWHCAYCGKACSMMGHSDCLAKAREQSTEEIVISED